MPGKTFETGRPSSCFHPFSQNGGMYHENKSEIRYAVRGGAFGAGFHDFPMGGVYAADCTCEHDGLVLDGSAWMRGSKLEGESLTELDAVVGGLGNQATAAGASALGVTNIVTAADAQGIGEKNWIYAKYSVGVGVNNKITGEASAAFGIGNVIGEYTEGSTEATSGKGEGTFVFGSLVKTAANNAIVLGSNIETVADNSVVIGNGSTSTEENTVSVGSASNQRRIVNVAKGTADTDAVNKGQLDQAIDAALADIGVGTGVTERLNRMDNDIAKVGAGAAALAALHPEGFDPADKWSFAVGYGHYRNANAGALGAFYKPNFDTTVSIGGTIGNGDPMLNAGVSFKLGRRSARLSQNASDSQLVQEVNALRADNNRLRDDSRAQAEKIERLEAQVAALLAKVENR